MQIRKLVKSGHSSLVLAVPHDWIKRNKLKAGELVYITEELNKLKITTEFKSEAPKKEETVINVDGKDEEAVTNEITSAYMNNYFLIIIKGKQLSKVVKTVKKCIVDLVALELMDESSERIVARSFLDLYDVDLKLIVRRIDNIVRSMMIDTKAAVKNARLVNNIMDRDEELNRLSFLVFKILKAAYLDKKILKSLQLEDLDILRYWNLNIYLEKIGDRVKNIAEIVPKLVQKRKKQFIELFSQLEEFYKNAMKAFHQFSPTLAGTTSKERTNVLVAIENYIKHSNCLVCSEIAEHAFDMTHNINDINRVVMYLE